MHAAEHEFRVGMRRIHHDDRGLCDAERLYKFEGGLGAPVQIDEEGVKALLQQMRGIVNAGRILGKLMNLDLFALCQSGSGRDAPRIVGANDGDKQAAIVLGLGRMDRSKHSELSVSNWRLRQ